MKFSAIAWNLETSTSEVNLDLSCPARMLSKNIGNSMPVLGSTACLVQFKSENDRPGHPQCSTSQGLWSMDACTCTSPFSKGIASTFEALTTKKKKATFR